MMQHLTPDMLAELTPEAKERLRKWWKPQTGDWTFLNGLKTPYLVVDVDHDYMGRKSGWLRVEAACDQRYLRRASDSLPLLSIGQLIELLGDTLGHIGAPDGTFDHDWVVETTRGKWRNTELIRALWDAVKAVLEVGE